MNRRKWVSVLLLGLVCVLAISVVGCSSPPAIEYGPSTFEFSFNIEGHIPPSQTLSISNVGGEILDWAVASDV